MVQRSLFTKQKQTHRLGGWDWHRHITIYKTDNKDLPSSTGNATHYSLMAFMGKNPKKQWIYVYE